MRLKYLRNESCWTYWRISQTLTWEIRKSLKISNENLSPHFFFELFLDRAVYEKRIHTYRMLCTPYMSDGHFGDKQSSKFAEGLIVYNIVYN